MGIFIFPALLLLLPAAAFASDTFDYRPSNIARCSDASSCEAASTFAPQNWPKLFTDFCSGSAQSPIDIGEHTVHHLADPFVFMNYDTVPGFAATFVNNGHQASLQFDTADTVPTISGGGLAHTYSFASLHFHWGSHDGQGSEHTVNGLRFPLEMHMIHYNSDWFDSQDEAIASGNADALVVMATLFHIADEDNWEFSPIISALSDITEDEAETAIEAGAFRLADLLPNTHRFWQYAGSLTTPACDEVVSWTVFQHTIGMSSRQMESFRALTYDFHPAIDGIEEKGLALTDIYRPTQALNGRTVHDVKVHHSIFLKF